MYLELGDFGAIHCDASVNFGHIAGYEIGGRSGWYHKVRYPVFKQRLSLAEVLKTEIDLYAMPLGLLIRLECSRLF